MNKKIIWLIFGVIIIIAVVLRLWQLGNTPPSPDWDEVAIGYDAYSLIHTGKDEFGKAFPVVLRSFDDYKPAMYAYLTIPSIIIFGLNTFAVRLPSAIFGIISVIAVFYLLREIFGNSKLKDPLSLLASFLLAISPWSLQFSRVGFESNVGDAFNILMVLFFVKGLKKPWLLSLSALFAAFSIYTYQSEKVFTPLLAILLIIIYSKQLFKLSKKYLLFAFLTGFLVILPMVFYILTNREALLRVTGTSIFSYKTELLKTDIAHLERDKQNNDVIGLIFDNRRFVYAKTIVSGYVAHFNPNWLFISGDIARHHAPEMGLLYLFEVPFILIGLYFLIFGDFDKKGKLLILGWLLLAPVPASITTGVPHAVRTLNFLPTWQIISALGLLTSFRYIKKYKFKYAFYALFALVFLFNFIYFLNQYFVQQNFYHSQDWQYGYSQAVDEVLKVEGNYDNIVVSDSQPLDKSYMFFLFYLKYPPDQYQKIGEQSSGSFESHHYFGKYMFRKIDWDKDRDLKNTLFIGPPAEIPSSAAYKTIHNLDGTVSIRISHT
jgi:4-amino-4-deoxy-L-arabinose transferase-like glycosyltransferase